MAVLLLLAGAIPDVCGAQPTVESRYALAEALHDDGLLLAAQELYLHVYATHPDYGGALDRAWWLTEALDSRDRMQVIARTTPPEGVRDRAQRLHAWTQGVNELADGEHFAADIWLRHASQLGEDRELTYLMGVNLALRGHAPHALKQFGVAMGEGSERDEVSAVEARIIDLAALGKGRVYYGLSRLDLAGESYAAVPEDSEFWARARVELAWVELRRERYDEVYPLVASIDRGVTPERRRDRLASRGRPVVWPDWQPDADYVRAVALLGQGRRRDVLIDAERIADRWEPLAEELEHFVAERADEPTEAYRQWLLGGMAGAGSRTPLVAKVLQRSDLSGLVRVLDRVERELAILGSNRLPLEVTEREVATNLLLRRRAVAEQRAGEVLIDALKKELEAVKSLLGDVELLAFEATDSQTGGYPPRSTPEWLPLPPGPSDHAFVDPAAVMAHIVGSGR